MIIVKSEQCPQDHKCPMIRLCPQHSVEQKGFAAPTINQETCISCGLCVKNCPHRCFVKQD